jgi:glycosyltransferase involved in cell wall biosynthesis
MAAAHEITAGKSPLSVVVPVYNEEATLSTVVARLLALPEVCQIVIVNDCSTDRTREIADSLARQNPKIDVVHHASNKGKTQALKTGFALTTGEIVIVQDADLEYDPAEIRDVIAPIVEGHADVVYGSRFLVRKACRVLYYYHYLGNKFLTFLSNLLTNLNMTDVETGYKAFRGEIIRNMRITSSGFGFEIEATAKIAKLKGAIYEVPISYHGRTYEQGKKIGLKDGLAALWYIIWFNLFRSLNSSFIAIPKTSKRNTSASTCAVICALLFFAVSASIFVPAIGIEGDEVLFVPTLYHPEQAAYSVKILGHSFPKMLFLRAPLENRQTFGMEPAPPDGIGGHAYCVAAVHIGTPVRE